MFRSFDSGVTWGHEWGHDPTNSHDPSVKNGGVTWGHDPISRPLATPVKWGHVGSRVYRRDPMTPLSGIFCSLTGKASRDPTSTGVTA
jgi:hypothetical protein